MVIIVYLTLFTAILTYLPISGSLSHYLENDINARKEIRGSKIDGLTTKIKGSFGRELKIKINVENHDISGLSFRFEELPIPPKIQGENRANRSFEKYVFVHSEYTEQMSMGTLSILSLCGQAQFGGRKVVRPFVRKSRIVNSEKNSVSLAILYDLQHLNKLLNMAGYSPLVDKQEYQAECKHTDPNHVTIHFLYLGDTTKNWNRSHLRITSEFYDSIFEKTKATGWTNCSFLDGKMGIFPSTKQFCINPAIITDWNVLERDIVGGAKCLIIYLWRGIGGGVYRSYFTENHLKFPHDAIQFTLKPSKPIQNEVARFRETFLPDRYMALYVRAEIILLPHKFNFHYLKKCINVLVDVVNELKALVGISHVYVASDMSKHGSGSLLSYVNRNLDHNPFPEIFSSLISRVGGVVYNYNASTSEITDRSAIAIVDVTLLTQAQYLITAGKESMSSFLRWVIGTFLANHRDDKDLWSKISVCDM